MPFISHIRARKGIGLTAPAVDSTICCLFKLKAKRFSPYKTKDRLFRVSGFLVLFLSLFLTGLESVESGNLDGDDWLNLFGIPREPISSAIVRKTPSSIRILSAFSKIDSSQYHSSWGDIYTQLLTSHPLLSVPLRC